MFSEAEDAQFFLHHWFDVLSPSLLTDKVVVLSAAGAMNEFRIHHDVNELLSLLHVRGGDGAEGYIDLLQKHRTPYVTTTVSAHSAKVGDFIHLAQNV